MAATNYTPIQLYFSTTASAVPLAANLAQGELAINITDGKLYYEDNAGVVQVIATKGAGTIGGSTTQIQYNNAGALAGNAAMTFNSGTSTTTLTTLNLTNALGATYGGTAQSAYTQGDFLYASATNTLSKLGIGTVNYILTSTGSVPQWSAPSSIIVQTATNLAGGAGGSVPYQSAVDTTTFLAIGAANRVMTSSGTVPQWVTSLTGLTGVSSSSITNTSLTSGRVVVSTTAGLQADDADLTFDGTTLSAGGYSTVGLSTLVKTVTIGNSSFNGTAVFAAATPAKLYIGTGTVTDTTSSIGATNAVGAISSLAITPIAATNTSVTYTNAATLYIAGAPSAGTNVTLTNPYALYVAAGDAYFGGTVTAGTVNLTTLDLTNLEVTNIKAKDGTAAMTIADSTGVVSFTANPILSGGTANGVLYLNGSKSATSGSALTWDGSLFTVSHASGVDGRGIRLVNSSNSQTWENRIGIQALENTSYAIKDITAGAVRLYITTTGTVTTTVDANIYGLTVGRGAGNLDTNTVVGAGAFTTNSTGTNNVAVGRSAGLTNNGSANVFIGDSSGYWNSTGSNNVGVGFASYASNTTAATGSNNTAVGRESLYNNTTASDNTAVGYRAGYTNQIGSRNVSVGYRAGFTITGSGVVAIGHNALASRVGGDRDTAIGDNALSTVTSGGGNTAVGSSSLIYLLTGSSNVAVGFDTAAYLYSGDSNTSIGYQSAFYQYSGSDNVAVGRGAFLGSSTTANNTGSNNVAVGREALFSNTTASNNTAVGYQAGYLNQTGTRNTQLGAQAGYTNNGGSYNVYLGSFAGDAGSGSANTAIGDAAMRNAVSGTSGSYNVAVGQVALGALTSGSGNVAVGQSALLSNLSASNNTAVGYQAGYTNQSGARNVFLGEQAGKVSVANNNTFLGTRAGFATTGTNNTFVGAYNDAIGGSGYNMLAGNNNTILGCYTGNNDNLNIINASDRVVLSDGNGYVTYYNSSVSTYLLSSKTLIVKENFGDESINANTQITGAKSANASGVATAIYYCGHTNAHNLRIIARQNTANVGSWVGTVTVAYGTSSFGTATTVTQGTMGTIAVAYNNGGSPAYQIEVTLTYTGSAPTIYWFADGLFGDNEPYAI